jgi:hypothetical protein
MGVATVTSGGGGAMNWFFCSHPAKPKATSPKPNPMPMRLRFIKDIRQNLWQKA